MFARALALFACVSALSAESYADGDSGPHLISRVARHRHRQPLRVGHRHQHRAGTPSATPTYPAGTTQLLPQAAPSELRSTAVFLVRDTADLPFETATVRLKRKVYYMGFDPDSSHMAGPELKTEWKLVSEKVVQRTDSMVKFAGVVEGEAYELGVKAGYAAGQETVDLFQYSHKSGSVKKIQADLAKVWN